MTESPDIPFDVAEFERSIPERFAQVVRLFPDRTAVVDDHQSLSFAELDRASNRIAQAILSHNLPSDNPAAILLPHSVQAVAAIFGALKAGKVCLPINPAFPPTKIAEIILDMGADLLLVNHATREQAAQYCAGDACQIADLDLLTDHFPQTRVKLNIAADAPALITLTSGTTGKQRGVVWDQRTLLHQAYGHGEAYHLAVDDRITLLFPFESSAGKAILFYGLLHGCGLYLHNPRQSSREDLVSWLIQKKMTILHSPITLFRQILDMMNDDEEPRSLRLIILGGQALRPVDIEKFRRRFHIPPLMVHLFALNMVGVVSRYFIDSQTIIKDRVPAGYADVDKEILILDGAGQEVSEGEIGEIGIKGRYLAPGYWRNQGLTQHSFLLGPRGSGERIFLTGDVGRIHADGLLEHHGRKDFQTKIGGFTVQPDAVEAILREWEVIKDAAIIAGKDSTGEMRLIAYIVPFVIPAPPSDQIRRYLADRLPDYMVPAVFVRLAELPLNTNGKVDREALPAPDRQRPNLTTAYDPPGTPLETTLAKIWAEVLELDSVGIHDEFLDLGGSSLLASRIAMRVEAETGTVTPPVTLFTSSTVSAMALAILTHQAKTLPENELNRLLTELEETSEGTVPS